MWEIRNVGARAQVYHFWHSMGVWGWASKTEHPVFAHNSKSGETCKHCFGRRTTWIRLFNFGFPTRRVEALQTPSKVSSTGSHCGNTLLLNLHTWVSQPCTEHPLLAPQRHKGRQMGGHSWTKVVHESDTQGFGIFFVFYDVFAFWN